MLVIQEGMLKLQGFEFGILQNDLIEILQTHNWKMSLEAFQIAVFDNKTAVSQFEYDMAKIFITKCTRTTFPEHR